MEVGWDKKLAGCFEKILLPDEEIIWTGKPVRMPYLLTGSGAMMLGLLAGIVWLVVMIYTGASNKDGQFFFWLFGIIMFGQPLFFFFKKLLIFPKTVYAYSNKRILIRTGITGSNYISVDYNKISDIIVNENFIEKRCGVGTIKFFSGKTDTDEGTAKKLYDSWSCIEDTHSVFKQMKQIADEFKPEQKQPLTRIIYRSRPRRAKVQK